jgi:predicted alpha/beta-fold hydrolase
MSSSLKSTHVTGDHKREETSFTPYRAPRWLPGGHLQTIYAYYLPRPFLQFRRERWKTPDGDFIDLDWLESLANGAALIVFFHGLEGCSQSHYALSFANELRRQIVAA